jgi:hypothetical protein
MIVLTALSDCVDGRIYIEVLVLRVRLSRRNSNPSSGFLIREV